MKKQKNITVKDICLEFADLLITKGIKSGPEEEKRHKNAIHHLRWIMDGKPKKLKKTLATTGRDQPYAPRRELFFSRAETDRFIRALGFIELYDTRPERAWERAVYQSPFENLQPAIITKVPNPNVMALMFLSPGIDRTYPEYARLQKEPAVREAGAVYGAWDLIVRISCPSLAELHRFVVRKTRTGRNRIRANLLVLTDSTQGRFFWLDEQECRPLQALQKDEKVALAFVIMETKHSGIRLLAELKAEKEKKEKRGKEETDFARPVWGASVSTGDADVMLLVRASTVDRLLKYVSYELRSKKGIVQTTTYIVRVGDYWVKEEKSQPSAVAA